MYKVRVNAKVVWCAIARQNVSQNEFALKLGISSGYMSQLVCGTRYPSAKIRRKMLELTQNLTFNDLFMIEETNDRRHRD